jgi:tyrosyl-tRNA synthetase
MPATPDIAKLQIGPQHRTVNIVDVIADFDGCSKSQARRLIDQGAVTLSGEMVEHYTTCAGDAHDKVLKFGKRKFLRIKAL